MFKGRLQFVGVRQRSPLLLSNIWEADLFCVFPCRLLQSPDIQLIPTCATPAFRHPRAPSIHTPDKCTLTSAFILLWWVCCFIVLALNRVLTDSFFPISSAVSCPVSAAEGFRVWIWPPAMVRGQRQGPAWPPPPPHSRYVLWRSLSYFFLSFSRDP